MIKELLKKIRAYNPDFDEDRILDAVHFQEEAHAGQKRASGEPYSIHPMHVALLLTDLNMDEDTIIAGLLHDVLEDTDYTFEYVENRFGHDVAVLVDGVTKLKKIQFKSKQENQAENIRKMVMAMSNDIRIIIIKLCDRLHNMRTLEYMSDEKRIYKAQETLDIYAPLAHRLGINTIKWELEDLSLRYLEPEVYYDLAKRVEKKRSERELYIRKIIEDLQIHLDELHIRAEISGRPKSLYSVYKKMYGQNKEFEQIFDLTAIRIIVDSIKDCYGTLGVVHTLWKPLPMRFKDYIAMPKANMYQSLHTTVMGPEGETFEVQIRTWDMHRTAEYGIAAHWKYKEQKGSHDNFDDKLTWLRQLMEWQKELKDPKDFMESLKGDFISDEVYVFTPQGDVINLPIGSTPIDFAYRVHTAVGNNCVGAKIDGRIVPLNTKLNTGNIVEIITSTASSGPSRDWLKIVQSTQAKNKIRQFFKKEDREINIIRGRDALEKDVRHAGYRYSEILKEEWLQSIADKLGFSTPDDMYAAAGYGSITINQITSKLRELHKEKHRNEAPLIPIEPKRDTKKANEQGVSVKGIDNVQVKFAKCCTPVPGDEIIGYVTKGRGVSIHRSDCQTIANADPDRFIDVYWNNRESDTYQVEIEIMAIDRIGYISEVTRKISDTKLNVISITTRVTKDNIVLINVMIAVRNIESLTRLIDSIRNIKSTIDVYRIHQKG